MGADDDIAELLAGYFEGANDHDAEAWAQFIADDYTAHFVTGIPP